MSAEQRREDYVEYSSLLVLTWGCILVAAVGWLVSAAAAVGAPPIGVETVEVAGETAVTMEAQSGWLVPMMGVVIFSALLIESARTRILLEQHPGAASPGSGPP